MKLLAMIPLLPMAAFAVTVEPLPQCEFAAEPSETTLHLAKPHPCERGYTAFRPFKEPIPEWGSQGGK